MNKQTSWIKPRHKVVYALLRPFVATYTSWKYGIKVERFKEENGRQYLVVIDGGFCKAYQKTSGIAGYTLIYNSHNYRMVSHQPFDGRKNAITLNHDIDSYSMVFETLERQAKIADTDNGRELQATVEDLKMLLEAYRSGAVTENHH